MKEKFKRFIALLLILAITLPIQELQVFAETVSKNEVMEEGGNNGQVTNPIEPKTVSGEDMGEETFPETDATKNEFSHAGVNEERMPSAPVHHHAPDYTDFSYVYFGSYPQSEVTDSTIIAAIENAISTSGPEPNADVGVDVLVDGIKYRRISRSDTNYDGNPFGDSDYRYFKWEKIKWKVLQNDGNTLFVVADMAIDCKSYNEKTTGFTWESSTIREWLNGSFYNTAFSSDEQNAIVEQTVVNEDNPEYGTEGGNNTNDNIYLLSISEVTNKAYGFCSHYSSYTMSRRMKTSDYANARGVRRHGGGNCCWWLRSPGYSSDYAANGYYNGYVIWFGDSVHICDNGACPAMHINLSSNIWSIVDAGVGERTPSNPVHHCPVYHYINENPDYTDFNYVYFGTYPQSEVMDEATKQEIDKAINQGMGQAAGAEGSGEGVDVLVNGSKYRRISKADTNNDDFFDDVSNNGYRYFKWEQIKWRVLQNDGSTLFVVADKAIDCKKYNEEWVEITWENSTIREWLNGSFYHTAFSSNEQSAIVEQIVVNEDNPDYGTEGGNNTSDKIYLLSINEATNEAYGFCSDYGTSSVSRQIETSAYASARGSGAEWWLRSPGDSSTYAAHVLSTGYVDRDGYDVSDGNDGVCPALHINLQSDLWTMADDGEGGDDDEDNSRVQTPQASISGGAYTTSQKITLASATKGAEIYYTLNGTAPTTSSIKYTAPITITSSVVLKAIAIKNGCEDSQIMTEIYTINIPQNPSSFPANPIHNCNAEDGTQDTTTWSYIYFGSYPKSNVTDSATIAAIDAAIATSGMLADTGVDVWVDGTKYRRISRDETISNGIDTDYNEYFDDVPNNGYRYFKWERIKWKVLKNDGNTLFVAADEIMDCKDYSDGHVEGVTWETSSIRDWLNDGFYNTAFSRNEQSAIQVQTVVNEDVPEYDIQGGNDTKDKVYLLSISEVINQEYGFCSIYDSPSMSRRVKASDYADARGAHNYNGTFLWWLRSNGPANRYHASEVDDEGRLPRIGPGMQYIIDGVCPALNIKLSSGLWLTEDDGTSGEGGSYGKNILMGLQASKKKTEYMQNESLTLDDLTVTAVYENSSKMLPADTYTTNAAAIDMNTPGSKTLTISYTEGTITKTAAITITVTSKADTSQQAKKGTKITDKASAGTYKVTSADSEAPTVEYTAPTSTKKKTITIPEYVTYQGVKYKVTSVSAKSFKGNKKLTTIKIASTITKIGDSAFEGCISLKTVTIGTGLKTIGKNAFKNCKKLKTLTIKSSKLKTVGKNALKGINAKCKIKVPTKKVKAYTRLMKKKGQKSTVKITK